MGDLTKNFSLSEFRCNDEKGTPVPTKYLANVKELAKNLQVLRDDIGEPLHLLSGYRTRSHNKKVGGKPGSFHLNAKAGDTASKSFTPKQLAARVEKLIKAGKMKQGGLGIYKGFIHYDTRGVRARW